VKFIWLKRSNDTLKPSFHTEYGLRIKDNRNGDYFWFIQYAHTQPLKRHVNGWVVMDIMEAMSSGLWIQDCLAWCQRLIKKSASLMVRRWIRVSGTGNLHLQKGSINITMYLQVVEQLILPSRWRLFQGRPCIFHQDNAKPHTTAITTAWLINRRVWVLDWPACSPDLSPPKNIWHIVKCKTHTQNEQTNKNTRPRIVEQLEFCKIPSTGLNFYKVVKYLTSSIWCFLCSIVN